ncbi:hypothetical protein DMH03_08025 [Amycolatopsis sp. WAC 01376]|uniref:hypothetical protein n=1 Tax=Amycolatopsis sp. WAC 01376 TaxID=2203195 RepID=UPI000F77594D|nr:hypothetical protein [Amycolatopsis sp. WAC 01376]RSM67002.1 hypothetical protein DMH03_08025 [Amycolatopsis sp. WAC 01376]
MQDLRWDEVRSFFDPDLMGALPDVFVPAASAEDWQQGATASPLPLAKDALARPVGAELAELRAWPVPGMLAIFRLTSAEEIDFDIDLRELQGQAGVDTLCGFLAEIGRELRKPVLMTPEGGSQAHPVLGFDPALDRVVLMAAPPAGG